MIPITLEVNVVDHCNLNCRSCDHLAPVCKENYYDLEELERNYKTFDENTNGEEINKVTLFGGEPLLHPGIDSIIKTTRSTLNVRTFGMITNGLLLDTLTDETLELFVDNGLELVISDYHVKDLSRDLERLVSYGISYNVLDIDDFMKFRLDRESYKKRYDDYCMRVTHGCVCLSHGKIYHCGAAANSRALGDAFGEDFLITRNDFLSVSVVSKERLVEFATYPSDFCTYCSFSNVETFAWRRSERKKEEWVR